MENHRGSSSRGASTRTSQVSSGSNANRTSSSTSRARIDSLRAAPGHGNSGVSFSGPASVNSSARMGSPLRVKTMDSASSSFSRNNAALLQPSTGLQQPVAAPFSARTPAPPLAAQGGMIPLTTMTSTTSTGFSGSSVASTPVSAPIPVPAPAAPKTHQHHQQRSPPTSSQHPGYQHQQQPQQHHPSVASEDEEAAPFSGNSLNSMSFVARNSREGIRRSHAGLINIEEGDLVWVDDPILVCVPAVVMRVGFLYDEVKDQEHPVVIVHTEDGEEREIRDVSLLKLPLCHHSKQLVPASLNDLTSIPLCMANSDGQMEFFSSKQIENVVLHMVRARYRVDLIYTWLDKILISVNPCQALPIYTPEQMRHFGKANELDVDQDDLQEIQPHVFALAQNAFHAMHESKEDQAIVVLGAMGSGKSEASKLIVQYLCEIGENLSGRSEADSDPALLHPIAQQILHSFTILESFGNASTRLNANSSRVGKMISVEFSRQGAVIGGGFTTHYFERSRVIEPKSGERNFHVFYQVLAGVQHDPSLRDSLELNHSAADFELLKTAENSPTRTALDARDYRDLMSSFSALRIRKNQRIEIIRIVAALLHLGNVEFIVDKDKANATDSSPCSLKDPSQIVLAAKLLEVEPVVLDNYFRTRQFFTKEGNKTVSSLKVVSVTQARRARDTFVRSVYEALFGFLVDTLNGILGGIFERYEKSNIMVNSQGIHVLDIVGFEHAGADGFDQLCFNYWSEKVHSFFLQSTLSASNRTNVDGDTSYSATSSTKSMSARASLEMACRMAISQSEECLSLFENVPFGIFSLLNEHGKVRNAHDEDLVSKIWAGNEGVKCLKRPLMTHNELLHSANPPKEWKVLFVVKHYCAEVTYSGKGLAAKNTLTISSTCAAIMQSSKNSVLHAVGTTHMAAAAAANAASSKSGNKFQGPISMSKDAASMAKSNSPDSASVEMMRQADALLHALTQTGKHFMVCIKPNERLDNHLFDADYIVNQLRDFHVVNLVQSSRASFSVSMTFTRFFHRYRGICGHRGSFESLIRSLSAIGVLEEEAYQVDNDRGKVLLTAHQTKVLDKAREAFLSASAVIIQRNLRLRAIRKKSQGLLDALRQLRSCIDKKHNDGISRALAETKTLLSQSNTATGSKSACHVRIIRKAQDMLLQMDEEEYISSIVEDATKTGHPVIAQFAIQVATNSGSSISTKHLQRFVRGRSGSVQAIMKGNRQLEESNAMLRQFIINNQPEQLIGALASVDGPSADSLERKLGTMMVIRSLEEKSATEVFIKITGTRASGDQETTSAAPRDAAWNAAVVKMVSFGLESKYPDFLVGSNAPKSPSERRDSSIVRVAPSVFTSLLNALKKAMEEENLIAAERILERLKGLNMKDARMQDPLIKQAEEAVAAGRSKLSSHSERQQTIKLLSIARLSQDLELMNDAIKAAQTVGLAQWDFNLKNAIKERDRLQTEQPQENASDDLSSGRSPSEDESSEDSDHLISSIWHVTSLDELMTLKRGTAREAGNASPSVAFAMELLDIKIRRREALRQVESTLLNATKCTKPRMIEEAFEKAIKMGYWSKTFAPLFDKYYELANSDETEDDLRAVVSFLNHRLEANAELRQDALSLLANQINLLVEKQQRGGPSGEGTGSKEGNRDEELLTKAGKLKRRLESLVSNREKLESMLQLPEEKLHATTLLGSLEAAKAAGVQGKLIERVEAKAQALSATAGKDHQNAGDSTCSSGISSDPSPPPLRWNRSMSTDVGQENINNGDRLTMEELNATAFHRFENLRGINEATSGSTHDSSRLPPRPPQQGVFLQWESRVLPQSLCVMPDFESEQLAVVVNKCILGYMRDRIVFYREMLAQYILQIGLAHQSYIIDEIYLQLMKQLLRNPKRDSSIRGWCLFAMCVSSFAPSIQLEKHVLMFLKSQVIETNSFWRLVKSVALFCLRKLENLLTNGASGFIPSMEEIRAYEVRPPFLATIELMDGTPLADGFPVTPELTVAHLVEICVHFLGLSDQLARFFGISALSESKITSDLNIGNDDPNDTTTAANTTANTGSSSSSSSFFHKFLNGTNFLSKKAFLGDIFEKELIRGRENQLRFVLKIRLSSGFLLQMGKQDAMLNRLIYVQLSDDIVKGHLPLLEKESVVRLTCLAMAVDGGEDFWPTTLEEILDMNVMEYIPTEWQEQAHGDEIQWAALLLDQFLSMQSQSSERQISCNDVQEVYIEEASRHRLFGSVFFPSKLLNRKRDWMALIGIELPAYFVLAVNRFGVFVVAKDGVLVGDFDFMEVLACIALGVNSHQVKLIIRKQADGGLLSSSAGSSGMAMGGGLATSLAASEEILLSTKYSDELCDLITDYKQLATSGVSATTDS